LERSRIAKDIHDDLGANLTEISLLSDLAQGEDVPRDEKETDLKKIGTRARELTDSIADIVWAVNPQHDALDSFISYACTHAEDYLRSAQLHCRLNIPTTVPAIPLTSAVRHNLFLALKEALNNIVKHAHASEVSLRFSVTPRGLRLAVEDNGCGFDPRSIHETSEKNRRGHGLFNMRRRMEDVGGTFRLQSQPRQGTRIELELPLKRP
jgi:signal transduction histidine kinase